MDVAFGQLTGKFGFARAKLVSAASPPNCEVPAPVAAKQIIGAPPACLRQQLHDRLALLLRPPFLSST